MRTIQINAATNIVFAIVGSVIDTSPPPGVIFVVSADPTINVYWVYNPSTQTFSAP